MYLYLYLYPHTTPCSKEYDPLTDQGVHLNFWDGRCEAKMGFMVIEWESMGFNGDLMGFNGDWMGINGSYSDLMVI